MAIILANAQIYFGASNHHKAAIWSSFSQGHRIGAIASARRILARGLGRPMADDEPAYTEGDRTRDEYAVYEQALWMLENGQVAVASGNDPIPILTGKADIADTAQNKAVSLYAPEALRWLGQVGGAVIRG